MTRQETLKLLMLSPIYFRLSVADRKKLVEEFSKNYGAQEETYR